jgi:hypothetical protein
VTTDLERRIARIEDRHALEDLANRYFLACDDLDYATLGSIFTDDAEFVGTRRSASGKTAIVELFRGDRGPMGMTIHTPNLMLFTFIDNDRATGIVSAHCELAREGTTVYGAMRYYDEYVREDDAWRFARREIRMIHVGPWADVATSLTAPLPIRWPGEEALQSDLSVAAS